MRALTVGISAFSLLLILGCASTPPVLPEKDSVEVSREAADEDCQKIGKLTGSTVSVKGTPKDAVEDLKRSAALKGANYVVVEEYSAIGTRVTGMAYRCD